MKIIGVTGGVGSGKTELLHYIEKNYRCRILLADEASHEVMQMEGGFMNLWLHFWAALFLTAAARSTGRKWRPGFSPMRSCLAESMR